MKKIELGGKIEVGWNYYLNSSHVENNTGMTQYHIISLV
jgi:hypothetical protein